MKRAIMAALLMLLPAVSFAQHITPDHPLTVPKVPELGLVPTRVELEIIRQESLERKWQRELHTMPQYRGPMFGDYEQELAWQTNPFSTPWPLITIFRF